MVENTEVYVIRTKFYKFINYTYLVRDVYSNQVIIIDPSWEVEKIIEAIEKRKSKVTGICLTHYHYDHTKSVNDLVELYNTNVFISKKEVDFYKYSCKKLNVLLDKEELIFGRTKIICIETPGHTKGGMCFLCDESIFTGDTLFIEGCGGCYDEGSSPEEMYKSLQRLKKIVKNNFKVYPGHSYGTMPGEYMREVMEKNIYLSFNNEEDFIKFRMRENQPPLFSFK